MNKTTRYSPEVRELAVRLVLEQQAEYEPQWAAMSSIAAKIGCMAETLCKWVSSSERAEDQALHVGFPAPEASFHHRTATTVSAANTS
jgi:transposase